MIKHFIYFLIFLFSLLSLYYFLSFSELSPRLGVTALHCFILIYFVILKSFFKTKFHNYIFINVLLYFLVIQRGVSIFDTILFGFREYQIPLSADYTKNLLLNIFKSEFIFALGVFCLLTSFTFFLNKRKETNLITFANNRYLIFVLLYIIFLFIKRISKIDLGALSQVFNILHIMCIVILFKYSDSLSSKKFRLYISFLLGLLITFFYLDSGMKELIILPLLPFLVLLFKHYKSRKARVLIISSSFLLLIFLQAYITVIRLNVWDNSTKFSTIEIFKMATENISFDQYTFFFDVIFSRLNLTNSHTITTYITDRDGFVPNEVFGPIIYTLIPRLFWPDKPVFRPGEIHTFRIRQEEYDFNKVVSASAAGFFNEQYLGFGFFGVISFSLFYGTLISLCINFISKGGFKILLISEYYFSYLMLRLDETSLVYSVLSIISATFIFIFLQKFSFIIKNNRY